MKRKVSEFCEQIRGVSYSPKDVRDKLDESSITLLRATNIQDGLLLEDLVYVDRKKVSEKQKLKMGDILICASSGSKHLVGKAVLITEDLDMTFGAFCKVVRPKNIDANYLGQYFQSPLYRRFIAVSSAGANINNIKNEDIDNLDIILPPLPTQQRIAAELDAVCGVLAKQKQQYKLLGKLVKSKFNEMFGCPVANEMGWKVNKIEPELGKLDRGVSKHRPRNAPELLGGEYPLIQTGEVASAELYIKEYKATYSEIGLKQSKMWKKGTLCITIAANIAKTAILDFDACFPDSVVGFTTNEKANSIFMHYWFSFFQKILEEQAPESAQKNINLQILRELNVITPPIELQNAFSDFVTQTEQTKTILKIQISQTETLYKALMQKYFESEGGQV